MQKEFTFNDVLSYIDWFIYLFCLFFGPLRALEVSCKLKIDILSPDKYNIVNMDNTSFEEVCIRWHDKHEGIFLNGSHEMSFG